RRAALLTNAPPGSTDRSAISSNASRPSTSNVPHRNSAGVSTASAPDDASSPRNVVVLSKSPVTYTASATPAPTTDVRLSATCAGQRWFRGSTASNSTPTAPAVKTINSGSTAATSILGTPNAVAGPPCARSITRYLPSPTETVGCTDGVTVSSTGFG